MNDSSDFVSCTVKPPADYHLSVKGTMFKVSINSDGVPEIEPNWISVKDRLPEEYDEDRYRYLVTDGHEIDLARYFDPNSYKGNSFWQTTGQVDGRDVAHYMPLPPPPKEEK